MIVKNIELKNFRNYENEKIEFSPNINIIYGNNAQGKTNILEGIYLFSMGKSNRTYHDEELIKFGSEKAELNMEFFGGKRDISAQIIIKKNNKKSVFINEIPIKRNSDLIGRFNVVYFGPECVNIIKGGPSLRRKNIDIIISQLKSTYFLALGEYKKAIESKNSLLKNGNPDRITLEILNEKIIDLSLKIIKYRFFYIKKIEVLAGEIQRGISNDNEKLNIKYLSCVGMLDNFDESKIKGNIKEKINSVLQKEIEYSKVLFGVHHDDIEYFLNGKNVKNFGSQGQKKTVALVQKIAEVKLICEEIGEYPVLLLDDIMSELDILRQEYVLTEIKDMKIIITSTDKAKFDVLADVKEIKIEKGRLI